MSKFPRILAILLLVFSSCCCFGVALYPNGEMLEQLFIGACMLVGLLSFSTLFITIWHYVMREDTEE